MNKTLKRAASPNRTSSGHLRSSSKAVTNYGSLKAVNCDIHSVTYDVVLESRAGGHPEVDLIRSPTYDVVARLICKQRA
eukprot:scaffold18276_cov135-Skeletonema_marinoi.AAC.2